MSLKPKKSKASKKKRKYPKPKRLTKTRLRELLRNKPGGWSSKMMDDPKKIKTFAGEYPVTLEDRYAILQYHRKQLVAPILKGTSVKVKIDKDSLIQQEEAYDGHRTDLVYNYKLSKSVQKIAKKESLGGFHGWSYSEYLEKKHGHEWVAKYFAAEDKAVALTFGEDPMRSMGLRPKTIYDDWDEYTLSFKLGNEWSKGWEDWV